MGQAKANGLSFLHGCNISCDGLYVIKRTTFCAVFVEYCTIFCAIMVKWGLLGVYCTNNSAVSGKRCTIICAVICTTSVVSSYVI